MEVERGIEGEKEREGRGRKRRLRERGKIERGTERRVER